ncbi:MAG TPA: ABC transporter ATP-binding protein [Candidatus Blautia merdipullorum]|nr:ABC transporter ATP-binding protein [Candidatus Blautia merdipullorum]
MEKLLEIQHMMKYYGNKSSLTKAVDDISFSVEKGEFTAVMGASGSGKTTLLNCISTIDRVTGGHILVEGKDVTKLRGRSLSKFRREKLGFIFQDFNLLDTLNGFDNIALALQIQNEKPARIPGKVEEMAKKLNIREVLKKYPYQMSGGQKQRCACARAMITNPSLILADEPTGALDSQSAGMLLDNLQFLNRELGATILMVTHDPLCASYSDRVLFLKDGKLFHELRKGEAERKGFFDQIIHVIALLGGDLNHVV